MLRAISKMLTTPKLTAAENNGRQTGKAQGRRAMDAFHSLAPDVLQTVRQILIEQETAFQRQWTDETFSSLWAHSARVGRTAFYIAKQEGCPTEPALLAGLFHDMGKFAHGRYHTDDTPEEENAVLIAERILSGTVHEKWMPTIKKAILSCYLDGETTNDVGRIVFDADCLDKLGNIGVAQFFAKKAMRRQFLDEQLMIRMSVELTYAHHAPDTLKTATGRALAKQKGRRTRRFFTELVEEWTMLGFGDVDIIEEEIAGIVCLFVVPRVCSCGGFFECHTDIRDAVKCRSAIVTYRCVDCRADSEYAFCLPNVDGLPNKSRRRLASCA